MMTGRITGLALRDLEEVALQHPPDVLLEDRGIDHLGRGALAEGVDHPVARLVEDVAGRLLVHEAPVHDVGTAHELAGSGRDRHDDHDDAVPSELPAVAQDLAAHITDPQAVDEGHPGANALHPLDLLPHLDDIAILADQDVFTRDADLLRDPRVAGGDGVPHARG